MNMLRQRWNNLFYEPTSPLNLALCRILLFASLFWWIGAPNVTRWASMPDAAWQPMPLFKLLHLPVFSASTLAWMSSIWAIAVLLSCLGLFTRLSTIVVAALSLYLFGLPYNFGKIDHSTGILAITLVIMAASRCGDVLSLDCLIRRWRNHDACSIAPSWEYTWPVRLCWAVLALAFCNAGVSKLRCSGLDWIFSDNLANTLTLHYFIQGEPPSNLGLHVAQYPLLCSLMALATIVIEVAAPLALFSRPLRWVIVPSLFLMQLGISQMLGLSFTTFRLAYLLWLPWDRLVLATASVSAFAWHALLRAFALAKHRSQSTAAREPSPDLRTDLRPEGL